MERDNTCNALKSLKEGIEKQCLNYLKFHPRNVFGSMPGMYELNEFGEEVPTGLTSGYLRGGLRMTRIK